MNNSNVAFNNTIQKPAFVFQSLPECLLLHRQCFFRAFECREATRNQQRSCPCLEKKIVYKYLVRVADQTDQLVADILQSYGLKNLSRSHVEILSFVAANPGVRATDVATTIDRRKATVTVLIQKLERLGYLMRMPDPIDGRAIRLHLSKSGLELMPVLARIYATLNRRIAKNLTTEESEVLQALLLKLYDSPIGYCQFLNTGQICF